MSSKLLIIGAAGRMGRLILSLAVQDEDFQIVGAVERTAHPDTGKDAGLLAGIESIGIEIAAEHPSGADVVIDFSQPEAVKSSVDYCLKNDSALVMGTTGLSDQQRQKLKSAAGKIPVLYGTNMSAGMNVLFSLVGKVASMLGEDYDAEIIEQHHRFKKDAPSGTALTLAENISKATNRDYPACLVHGRGGQDSLRKKGTIGIHAIRAGNITGRHEVIFGTLGETVTLSHSAQSKTPFAQGALRAAKWLIDKQPGYYSMTNVLRLE